MQLENADRFNGRSSVYDRSRPTYPAELLRQLITAEKLDLSAPVADIGAGTGIFTRCLAEAGFRRIFAVEPNAEFRARLAENFAGDARVTVLDGAAEQTGLPAGSVDLVTAAQAFHWFDRAAFRTECRRIARSPGTIVALAGNHRVDDGSGLYPAQEAVCRKYGPEFTGFSRAPDPAALAGFFRNGGYREIQVVHDLIYPNAEAFVGRLLSASYAPRPGTGNYSPFCAELREIFNRYRNHGGLRLANIANCCYGRV